MCHSKIQHLFQPLLLLNVCIVPKLPLPITFNLLSHQHIQLHKLRYYIDAYEDVLQCLFSLPIYILMFISVRLIIHRTKMGRSVVHK